MKVYENFDLTQYNSYRLKARCATAVFPETEADLLHLYGDLSAAKKIVLGNGNNILLTKEWYDTCFVIFNGSFDTIAVNDNEISAQAGATMLQLSETAWRHKLSGLEIFYDIPSSVAGAVVMNAGAAGEEIKNVVKTVRYLDVADMRIKEIGGDKMEFSYRNSYFQKHDDKVVLQAWFSLTKGNPLRIKEKMETAKQIRWARQPRGFPSGGSVFKRPSGRFVGPMIDQLGLKGFTVGGAKISEKHSGFIVNTGGATGKDILTIIRETQRQVKEEFGIDLEVEQRII
ncbi:UDP-N-acetylmuramate dehydrogenase [Desulfofustis glycolicus]|uniref:UDP-N-acetylenolpyruvoylglucosamine reductase n=1 Tax=Desulfofustis glycolicus DSM 9705 TaxID=1121409 RepID=A0A1M5YNN5_9BACT|nr:UDP-N-acetylmuramate dehydrogenase [Desulfofustis glycolicus]SHI13464.1 UDP-N-acetylmuramate dehydrogenase [Desulfofustis glycolicus DSM 9705]